MASARRRLQRAIVTGATDLAAGDPRPRSVAASFRILGLLIALGASLDPAAAVDKAGTTAGGKGLLGAVPIQTVSAPTTLAQKASTSADGSAGPAAAGESGQPQGYASPEVRQTVALVQAAAAAIRGRGEAVFPELRQQGGPWFQGETYVVVLDPQGRAVVYPPDARGEGLNYLNFEDLGGRRFGRQFIAVAEQGSGSGWVHYQWRRPNQDRRPVWKATYLERATAPSGQTYLVLSGIYDPPMERAFLVDAVESGAALLKREGRAAFPALRDPRGPFHYQDTYVFVVDADGTLLLNPGFPALEGRNLLRWPDPAERARATASLRAVMSQGSAWATYSWPRPTASPLPERKTTYLRKVVAPNGEVLIVGSGMYAGG